MTNAVESPDKLLVLVIGLYLVSSCIEKSDSTWFVLDNINVTDCLDNVIENADGNNKFKWCCKLVNDIQKDFEFFEIF